MIKLTIVDKTKEIPLYIDEKGILAIEEFKHSVEIENIYKDIVGSKVLTGWGMHYPIKQSPEEVYKLIKNVGGKK